MSLGSGETYAVDAGPESHWWIHFSFCEVCQRRPEPDNGTFAYAREVALAHQRAIAASPATEQERIAAFWRETGIDPGTIGTVGAPITAELIQRLIDRGGPHKGAPAR